MPKDELIGRLEKADGPDRELDEALHEAFGLTFVMEYYTEYATEQTRNLSYVPAYTASIDSALTLVPEGWTCAFRQQDDGGWHVELREGYCTSYNRVVLSRSGIPHPPLPLAICIAALRAKGDE